MITGYARNLRSSLRAQRSNPLCGYDSSGLLRRFAPRKKLRELAGLLTAVTFHPAGSAQGRYPTRNDGTSIASSPGHDAGALFAPYLFRDIDREPQLRPLLFLGEDVTLFGRGEAALRRNRELIQGHEFSCFFQPTLDVVLFLQFAGLRGDDANHHDLVALWQIPQRLEAAGAFGIIFEEIAVVVGAGQHGLRHRLITAGRNPGGAEIAAADMRGDGHVGRPLGDRIVDHTGIDFLQAIGIVAVLARLLQFILRAEIGPHGVIELQIAAAGVVERLHRLAIGLCEVLEENVEIGIHLFRDRPAAAAEMQHRWRGDRHLRHHMRDLALPLQELEMRQHRMIVGEIQLADHAYRVVPGLDARELNTLVGVEQFAAGELCEKVEMPPRAAEFAVGRKLQADRRLLVHDLFDFHVLDLAQIGGRNLALLQFGTRLLDLRRPQQAADLVSTERGFCSLHGLNSYDDWPALLTTSSIIIASQRVARI